MKRKQISTKTRFEIFKRDQFTCQYCGAIPPKAILHVDHIVAVAAGGVNDSDNYVTACSDCNLGKGARPLDSVPQSLKDRASEISEREAQLLGYHNIMEEKRLRLEEEVWRVASALEGKKIKRWDNRDFASVLRFVGLLPFHTVLDAAEYSRARSISWSDSRRFRYFCSICWRKIREEDGPVS